MLTLSLGTTVHTNINDHFAKFNNTEDIQTDRRIKLAIDF